MQTIAPAEDGSSPKLKPLVVLGVLAFALALRLAHHIVWGYINMGKISEARTLAEFIARQQPDDGPILEALGYTASARRQYRQAAEHYMRAIAVRPRSHVAHYNLAKVFLKMGDRQQAAQEAKIAVSLYSSADYRALLKQTQSAP